VDRDGIDVVRAPVRAATSTGKVKCGDLLGRVNQDLRQNCARECPLVARQVQLPKCK
jgi:hypothetical protein